MPLSIVLPMTAAAQVRTIGPNLVSQVMVNKVLVQVKERNAGLNKSISTICVYFEHFVHVFAHVKTDAARYTRSSTSISKVPTHGEWPDRYFHLIGKAHDPLDTRDILRSDSASVEERLLFQDVEHVMHLGAVHIILLLELVITSHNSNIFVTNNCAGTAQELMKLG